LPIRPALPIVPARLRCGVYQRFKRAKIAVNSTDNEANGNVDYAKGTESRIEKEITVIRPFCLTRKMTMMWASAVFCVLIGAAALQAQSGDRVLPAALRSPAADPVLDAPTAPANPIVDPAVQQTSGCAGCGLHGYGGHGCAGGGCGGYGGANGCYPGRHCHGCDPDSICGRLFGCFYDELCCPDPCYEPMWIPEANAAFFQDGPRPITQTRIRWDEGIHYGFPDTSEFFWSEIGTRGPRLATAPINYHGLSLYQEIAAKGFSVFFELPYLSVDNGTDPGAGGFADMNVGFKSVLLDRELWLITLQFKTIIPTGNFTNGLGIGHVALEPAILSALKICPGTYLQTEIADWIPIGGDAGFAGSVFHYHVSLNQNLCHQGDCLNVVGTLERNGYSFRGEFTDFPSGAVVGIGGSNYVNAGPGIRCQFCDRVDLGVAAVFGFGNGHGPNQIYRTELRIRY
jgi:hypothetical protein